MSTQKESILNQFRNLLDIGEVNSAARIYWDWAYSYQKELNLELDNADPNTAQRVKDRILHMSGDHADQI
jgi:flagellar basal body P-ring protein FlgI